MIKTAAFIVIIAIRLIYQPSQAQQSLAPFASLPDHSAGMFTPASLISFSAVLKNNNVILEWIVRDNESADLFEVEKSTDGTQYTVTALVFGTDQPDLAKYTIREKAGKRRSVYRIKLVSKNKQTAYSPAVGVSPSI